MTVLRPGVGRVLLDRRLALAVSVAAVVGLSVVPPLWAHPHLNYDSGGYLAPPSLTSGRLPVVPVLYLLLGHDLTALVVVQSVVGGFCWAALLREMSFILSPNRRLIVMAAVVAVACSDYVVNWYAAILSESLSISLLVLLVASLARWQRAGTTLWVPVSVAAAWGLTRSTNAYILVPAGVLLLAYSLIRRRSWDRAAQAACILAVGAVGTVLAGQGGLWEQPFLHSVAERILPDPAFSAWFRRHGMPVSPALQRLAGPYYVSTEQAFRHSQALAPFRAWMVRSGQTVFAQFLLTHPLWALQGTFGRHEELGPHLIAYYGGGVSRPWYPAFLDDVFLRFRQDTLVALGLADLAWMWAAGRRGARLAAAGPWAAMVAAALATLTLDWAGDSWEVGRHSLDGTVAAALAGIMVIACLSRGQATPSGSEGDGGQLRVPAPRPLEGALPALPSGVAAARPDGGAR